MRIKNSFRNMSVSVIVQIINMILSFATRTVFVKLLAAEYLGLNGLFGNILMILSLSELGIGSTIVVNLYKPLAEKDEDSISKYMNFYRTSYVFIGCFIILFGIVSMPFLDYIVKTDVIIPNLRLIYFMYILNSALSYFFAYKRTILTADQKEYKNTINKNLFLYLQYILQIVLLLTTHNYLLYLCAMLLCTFLSNVRISLVADKQYPFLKSNKSRLNKGEIGELFRSLKSITYHKIGNAAINSTDNIIISSVLGVYWVGMYSNYSMIVSLITTFVLIVFAACSASIGSFNATETDERVYSMFKIMKFIGFWLYGFCSICLLVLVQPFINLWIGDSFILDYAIVFVIILVFYLKGILNISATFIDVAKLFIKTRHVPWIMAIINLVVSIVLVNKLGLIGVFIGTVVGYCATKLWIDPYVLCKYKFKVKYSDYLKFSLSRIIITVGIGFITYCMASCFSSFIMKLIICMLIPNVLFFVCFMKTSEMGYLINVIKSLLKRREKNVQK